jgi:hypothetical protein
MWAIPRLSDTHPVTDRGGQEKAQEPTSECARRWRRNQMDGLQRKLNANRRWHPEGGRICSVFPVCIKSSLLAADEKPNMEYEWP